MDTKFIEEQPNSFCCGPVALINARIKLGESTLIGKKRILTLKMLCARCDTRPIHPDQFKGTRSDLLEIGIKKWFDQAKRTYSIRTMKKVLFSGKPLIILYSFYEQESTQPAAHYICAWKTKTGGIRIKNSGHRQFYKSYADFEQDILLENPQGFIGGEMKYPVAWSLN